MILDATEALEVLRLPISLMGITGENCHRVSLISESLSVVSRFEVGALDGCWAILARSTFFVMMLFLLLR